MSRYAQLSASQLYRLSPGEYRLIFMFGELSESTSHAKVISTFVNPLRSPNRDGVKETWAHPRASHRVIPFFHAPSFEARQTIKMLGQAPEPHVRWRRTSRQPGCPPIHAPYIRGSADHPSQSHRRDLAGLPDVPCVEDWRFPTRF